MRTRSLLAAAVAASLLFVAGGARAEDDPDTEVARRLFKKGSDLYVAGAYEKALDAFEQALVAKPLPGFEFNIARCHDRLGQWAAALAAYERFVAMAADADEAREAAERIAVLERRVKSAGDRAAAEEHYRTAVAEYNAGRFAEAATQFTASHRIVAEPSVLYNIAEADRLAGDGRAALAQYEAFLREVPASPMRPVIEARMAGLRGAPSTSGAHPARGDAGAPPAPTPAVARSSAPGVAAAPHADAATGSASDRLRPVADLIKASRAGFRACFDRWSSAHPGIAGKVTLTFYLDPDGLFGQAHAETVGFDAPDVAGCVVAFARTLRYPSSTSGKYTRFTYPFDFKP